MRAYWVVALGISACGVDERRVSGTSAEIVDAPAVTTWASSSTDLSFAYGSARSALEAGRGAVLFAGQAIEAATILAGGAEPRTAGTLTERSDGRIAYDPMPGDRLLIRRASGQEIELVVHDLSGTGSDAESFLQNDHQIRVEYVRGAELTGEVWSARRGASRSAGISGDLVVDALTWVVDLQLEGTETFESDSSGSRYFDDHDLAGRIEGTAMRVDVREHWTYELVSAGRGLSDNRRGTASSAVRSVDSLAEIGGERVDWRGVQTRTAFRDGKPTELDTFWSGTGDVLLNGAVLGRVEKFATAIGDSGGFVGFQVVTPNGNVELERHQAY